MLDEHPESIGLVVVASRQALPADGRVDLAAPDQSATNDVRPAVEATPTLERASRSPSDSVSSKDGERRRDHLRVLLRHIGLKRVVFEPCPLFWLLLWALDANWQDAPYRITKDLRIVPRGEPGR